ncbi:MAG: sugar phosphate isomerase/epimerase [Emcibacteraceae bacterium]|nr:sugar phosphate isomerase/epimerase [Emcibacteraceae bacterium]MDG1996503.1 sugar phosphate isomerase/epimerase [Emcibacteraceae bacterium]
MNAKYSRRKILKNTSAMLTGAALLSNLSTMALAQKAPDFKFSLAEWSINKHLFGKGNVRFKNDEERRYEYSNNLDKYLLGDVTNLDFPRIARNEFNIDAVEYVNTFFFDKARDENYLKELKAVADGEGVRSLLIMCDWEGALGHPDTSERNAVIERHHQWVDAAAYLGCHSIRVNAQSMGTWDEQRDLSAEGLSKLADYADKSNINVIVENHGGLSSNGKWLASVMDTANHPRVGTLPDFGNFNISDTEVYDKYMGVNELMPYAKAVSVKSFNFDENGNEPDINFDRLLKIVVDNGYSGYLGIEYEGDSLSEYDGIHATIALLKRVISDMSKA